MGDRFVRARALQHCRRGRYRDLLARQGQACNDRQMLMAAFDTISWALAPVASAAPLMKGAVLASIEHFLTPQGPVIDGIIMPFFQDSSYNHFKDLRERLDSNLRQTQRLDPVFPDDCKGDDAVETYLKGAMLQELFAL